MLGSSFESAEESGEILSEINVTPLVDVVLVLLIVFMVTVPSLVSWGIDVNLPNATAAKVPSDLRLTVTLKKEPAGAIGLYANGIPTDREKIGPLVTELVRLDPKISATVAADEGIPYGEVITVVDRLADLGVSEFNLSTERGPATRTR